MNNVYLDSIFLSFFEGEHSAAINANVDCIYFTNINTQANVRELVECLPMVYSRVVFTEPIEARPTTYDNSTSRRFATFLNGLNRCAKARCRVDVGVLATFTEMERETKKKAPEFDESISSFLLAYGGLCIRVSIVYARDFISDGEDADNMTDVIRHADAFRFEIIKKGEK
jgi:hypothetical protein